MAAKKDKSGVEAVRQDIQALQESFWRFRDAMLTDAALAQAENQQTQITMEAMDLPELTDVEIDGAATLMAAIGHPQRLRMAMLLVDNPVTVNDLVSQLNLSTTGAAYHHLKVMMNQNLVEQPQRGTFALTAEATPGVRKLLAGVFGSAPAPQSGKSSKKKKK